MASKKRKNRSTRTQKHDDTFYRDPPALREPDPALFIQAYEADLVRGVPAKSAARSLEIAVDGTGVVEPGDGLIQWGQAKLAAQSRGNTFKSTYNIIDEDEVQFEGADVAVWVDRYDARLLLDTLPPPEEPCLSSIRADSPAGWSDLPSDAEDTFFMSADEIDSYRREKRRRIIDRSREERLRALREADGPPPEEEEVWGGSDEEPDDAQKELMRRTAVHLYSSPNPAQLEMRILANHGADKRFAFLRGRWSRAWKTAKGRERIAREEKEKAEKVRVGLGGLADYGDSDGEADGDGDDVPVPPTEEPPEIPVGANSTLDADSEVSPTTEAEEAAKEVRRARAKEWAEKRRALKGV